MMKLLFTCFSFVLFAAFFFSCEAKNGGVSQGEAGGEKADTIANEYAKGFRMISTRKGMRIEVLDPVTQEILKSYNLGEEKEYNSFSKNLHSVVALSATHVGALRKLKLEDKITGVSDLKYLCRPLSEKKVKNVGDIETANPEVLLSVSPDIILYSGFSLDHPVYQKLEQADLKTFLIYDWKEVHPLGRAEWLKVFGVLFGKEKEAQDLFYAIKSNYKNLKKKFQQVTAVPTVLAGTYWGDVFNAPAGESYMAQLLKDANVNYSYKDTEGTGSLSLGLEQVITENTNAEFWVNVSALSLDDVFAQSEKFKLLPVVQKGKMYSYIGAGNCFWENSPIEPDVLLEDLGKIFHPEIFAETALMYYNKVSN